MLRIDPTHARGAALALGSAVLFGLSTPFSKILLKSSGPLTLAGLLYTGAGTALLAFLLFRRSPVGGLAHEAGLRRRDLPVFAAALLCGSLLGPALMMFGLQRTSAVTGSLLLNLEPPLTIALAILLFREHLGVRQAGAALLILSGTVLVGYRPGDQGAGMAGVVMVAFACLAWSLDTNLNQMLSLRDPVVIGGVKTLIGGLLLLVLAWSAGEHLPPPPIVGRSLALGTVAYGVSIVLFIRSLRELGAARVAAYFATAPLAGAVAAVVVLREGLRGLDVAAMVLMVAGVTLLLGETHAHEHTHEAMEHDHAHSHDDEHHDHDHVEGTAPAGRHAHLHRHAPVTHTHAHVPDLHHRHRH